VRSEVRDGLVAIAAACLGFRAHISALTNAGVRVDFNCPHGSTFTWRLGPPVEAVRSAQPLNPELRRRFDDAIHDVIGAAPAQALEACAIPPTEIVIAMRKFNQEMAKANVLLHG